jgi:hypothetical protein
MHLPRTLAVPLLLLAGTAACARVSAESPTPVVRPDPIMIQVINRHPLDMKVFVLHGAEKTRIGTATALGTTRIRLNPRLIRGLGDIRLYAEAIGSAGRVWTEMLVLHPGDAVDWSLAYELDHSAVMVQ